MPTTTDAIAQRIRSFIENELRVPAEEIEPDINLGSFGMSSVAAVKLIGELEDAFGRRLSPTMVYDFPTIDLLTRAVASVAPAGRSA